MADIMLRIVIEDQSYEWHRQYITGAEIKQLARLQLDAEVYLAVQEPWDDEPVSDGREIDLARPGIDHFFVKKKLWLTINGKPFEWSRQFITGKQIRKLGQIDPEDEIRLAVREPFKDELVTDETRIDLALPGVEHFVSKEVPFKIAIIVNGREKPWVSKTISFEQVVILAFGSYDPNPNKVYTVTYDRGPHQNQEGSMVKGDVVRVKNKMIFNVTATDKS